MRVRYNTTDVYTHKGFYDPMHCVFLLMSQEHEEHDRVETNADDELVIAVVCILVTKLIRFRDVPCAGFRYFLVLNCCGTTAMSWEHSE